MNTGICRLEKANDFDDENDDGDDVNNDTLVSIC